MRPLLLLAFLAGCSETTLSTTATRLEVGPPMSDVGVVPVGTEKQFYIQVTHADGPEGEITGLGLVPLTDGDHFRFDAPVPITVERNATVQLPVIFAPQTIGFHAVSLDVLTDAEGGVDTVQARGAALAPALEVSPLKLDFGAPLTTASRLVRVTNNGPDPVELTAASFTNPLFSLDEVLPLEVDAGWYVELPVVFDPVDSSRAEGLLRLSAGDASLSDVLLLGNDCQAGRPEDYDLDQDGVTSCGGDCDDHDATAFPGAVEAPDDADDDCDNTVDEGTTAYDDDGDGFCEGPTCTDGSTPGDCQDGAKAVSPVASEVDSNGIDDDCDGIVDAGSLDPDGDGWTAGAGDCDDNNDDVFPDAPEKVDGLDNDCDLAIDEGTTASDDDLDGYCEIAPCLDGLPAGDCHDGQGAIAPDQPETPNGKDDDCDGQVDEGTVKGDDDGDGFTEEGGDCDDADPKKSPAAGNCGG